MCEGTIEAVRAPVGEIYNVGGGETASVWDILQHLEKIGGKPIARLVPVYDGELADLVEAGWVTPATNREPFVMPPGEIDETSSTTAALIAMREDERW